MVWDAEIWEKKEAQINEIVAKYCQKFGIENLALSKHQAQFNDICYMIGRYVFASKSGDIILGTSVHVEDVDDLMQLLTMYISLCNRYGKIPSKYSFCNFLYISPACYDTWRDGELKGKLYVDSDGHCISNLMIWQVTHPGEEYREILSPYHMLVDKTINGHSEDVTASIAVADKNNVGAAMVLNHKHNWSGSGGGEAVAVTRELVQRTVLISEVKAAPKLPTINAEE